ncbi:MAG: ABC transporter ATP-binding protein [Bacillota bacterium]|nr:ABC transporter ATP-binding protein [Bacillota bacterium]
MKTVKRLMFYLKGSNGIALLSLLFALISVFSKMAIPYVAGLAIQRIADGEYDISLHLILIGCFLVAGTLFRYLFDLTNAYLGQRVVKRMRDEAYEAINSAPISYIDSHYHGDLLLCLVNDIENVQTGLIAGASALYEGIVQIAITLVFMFMLNWVMALLVIFLTPLSILVSRFVSNANSKYFKAQNKNMAVLTAYSLESLNNLEATLTYGLAKTKEGEFDAINENLRNSDFNAKFATGWINPATRVVNNTIYAILCFVGALMIVVSPAELGITSFGVGALSSMLSYAYQYMAPFNEISSVSSEVSYAAASFRRIDDLICSPHDVDEGEDSLDEPIEKLKAEHIDFSYDGSRKIISDFDVDIYKGHKIALVGPTGCGKTTIINLLLRFYDPQQGGFIVNGKPSSSYSKQSLRKHIGMVLQETWLFKGSIADNIAYGRPESTREEIIEAAKKAHADEFIRQFPDGYETIVSNSSGLSTGQKQLLCVARIMLVEPEVVILDEATSNIDLRTELLLSQSFDELMRGKTSLVVAHRLSTIKNSDLIIVLKDGAIMEMGNFQQLLDKGGFFKQLYDSQLA